MDNNGLIDITEDIVFLSGMEVISAERVKPLLAEQKQKTREDTLNNIEAIWTRLMNETDAPVYKEIYASCIKALKI
jgi:HSP90 family molecular chaperone